MGEVRKNNQGIDGYISGGQMIVSVFKKVIELFHDKEAHC